MVATRRPFTSVKSLTSNHVITMIEAALYISSKGKAVKIGDRYGKWTVSGSSKIRNHVECECDCGEIRSVSVYTLDKGISRSCGCLNAQKRKQKSIEQGKHHPLYSIWVHMHERCESKNNPKYKWYGAKGVRVCDRWSNFLYFVSDVGERPSLSHSLDRYPDPNGNYEPGNVRWATHKQQCLNKRFNLKVKINGREKLLKEWCEDLQLPYKTVWQRISYGWTPEEALKVPLRKWSESRVYSYRK